MGLGFRVRVVTGFGVPLCVALIVLLLENYYALLYYYYYSTAIALLL